jgi:hypothetical protein
MLNIFRKIRQKLIEQDNLKRYIVYALGEVLLVMIGILLALQVNTWNENRKDRDELQKYLNGFLSDLTVDSLNYDRMNTYMNSVIDVNNSFLQKFKENQPIDEKDFKAAFRIFTIPPVIGQNSTFTEMQSSGKLNLIRDDSLKNKILNYYAEREYIRKVETLNNNVIVSQPISYKIDFNSWIHQNIDRIEEVDDLSFDFFNVDRRRDELKEYINGISMRSLMSVANSSIYKSGLKQSTELKKEILDFLKTY